MKKLMIKALLIATMFLTGMAASSPAQVTRYVREINPSAEPPYTNWTMAATSIADAVTVANTSNAGDIVLISSGVYTLTEHVLIENTIVRGAGGDRTAVVVNGQGNVRCFNLNHDGAVLANLTVSNGTVSGTGGGVNIISGTVSNCVITKSQSTGFGGGIHLTDGLVTDCLITSNTSDYHGGGVYLSGAGSLLRNSVIAGNIASYNAGGLGAADNSLVTNCMIAGNHVTHGGESFGGGGVCLWGPVQIADCVISNNWVLNKSFAAGIAFLGDATASYCTIIGNTKGHRGGGINLYGGANEVKHCILTSNGANYGGGIYVNSDGNLIRGCVIRGNMGDQGGGIYCYSTSSSVIRNCLIAGNIAKIHFGGGIYADGNINGEISNCTVIDNEVQGAVAGRQRGAGILVYGANNVFNCLVWSNRWTGTSSDEERDLGLSSWTSGDELAAQSTSVWYCCSPRDYNGAFGNITTPPVFVDFAGGDYRLAPGSGGINAGTNMLWTSESGAVDLDGNPRIDRFSQQVDIGCYERPYQGVLLYIQ